MSVDVEASTRITVRRPAPVAPPAGSIASAGAVVRLAASAGVAVGPPGPPGADGGLPTSLYPSTSLYPGAMLYPSASVDDAVAGAVEANRPTFTIGTVTTAASGQPASASLTGGPLDWTVNLTIPTGPAGPAGANGQSPNVSIGTVTSLSAGASATATLTGTFPNLVLNLGIPAGATGATGASPTISIGTVTTLPTGEAATATLTGTSPNLSLNLGLPAGATGPTGPAGSGSSLTVPQTNYTTYLSAGSFSAGTAVITLNPSVVNLWTLNHPTKFLLPRATSTSENGQSRPITLIVVQDDVGGRTVTFGGYNDQLTSDQRLNSTVTATAASTTPNSVSVYRFEWMGYALGWVNTFTQVGLAPAFTPFPSSGGYYVRGFFSGGGTDARYGWLSSVNRGINKRLFDNGFIYELGPNGSAYSTMFGNAGGGGLTGGSPQSPPFFAVSNTYGIGPVHDCLHEYGHAIDFGFDTTTTTVNIPAGATYLPPTGTFASSALVAGGSGASFTTTKLRYRWEFQSIWLALTDHTGSYYRDGLSEWFANAIGTYLAETYVAGYDSTAEWNITMNSQSAQIAAFRSAAAALFSPYLL